MDIKYLLLKKFRYVEELSLRVVEEKGITEKDCLVITRILTILSHEICSTSELSRTLGISRQAMHKQIQKLILKGWISLEKDVNNKRIKLVVLTSQGKEVIENRMKHITQIEEKIAKTIGKEKLETLKSILKESFE